MENNRYIRFDWAAKYMLRNKADYVVYEGFFLALPVSDIAKATGLSAEEIERL